MFIHADPAMGCGVIVVAGWIECFQVSCIVECITGVNTTPNRDSERVNG
jgi:hypothetical protein